ncbi:MAG TPA: M20/M25/M40 family metallo-hydrolase [Acidobacteriota bacterium]|nr:M20/M25/M40 family metallo-hydrolase [Acidobacteriota bacterium]
MTDLVDFFLHLATIEGTSLAERKVADEVTSILRKAGIRVVEDGSAAVLGGDSGNLLCFPPHYNPDHPAIMLTAHLDTIQSTANLKPIVDAGSIRSDGSTILGGDNRLGLSALVRLLVDAAGDEVPCRNFFIVFTVGEEAGLYGADAIDLFPYNPSWAYVFDCSKRPGIYIRESVGLHAFTAQFIGKSAHSGVAPEEGISAIQLASKAIANLRLGRIDVETTANIGKIHGGEAVNAIPAKVTVDGEVRSFSPDRIRQQLSLIEQTMRDSLGGTGALLFSEQQDFAPYSLSREAPMILELEQAMRKVGLTPQPIRYTGGSDANKYNARGIPAVNIGIGAQKPHSHEEFFLIEDLVKTHELAHELIRVKE